MAQTTALTFNKKQLSYLFPTVDLERYYHVVLETIKVAVNNDVEQIHIEHLVYAEDIGNGEITINCLKANHKRIDESELWPSSTLVDLQDYIKELTEHYLRGQDHAEGGGFNLSMYAYEDSWGLSSCGWCRQIVITERTHEEDFDA